MNSGKLTFVFGLVFSVMTIGSLGQCPPGEIEDCNGNCYPASWVGDGVCDDGYQFPSDFFCAEFNWDEGDCGCDGPMLVDCNGNCAPISLIGDGFCNDTESVNFNCALYNWDGGDCEPSCPDGEFMDCDGNCWPDAILSYLGDWHCHNTLWESANWNVGYLNLNLDCELFDFDGGDCQVWACTDPEAENYYVHATNDDGSCQYGECPPGTVDCMGNCVPENWIGTNLCDQAVDDPENFLFNGAYPTTLQYSVPLPGNLPRGMCVLPDGSQAYIGTADGIAVVDLDDNGECSGTSLITEGGFVYTCSSSIDGAYVFGASWTYNEIIVVETASQAVVATIPAGAGTLKMWTSHDGQRIYASNHDGNTVTVADVNTFELIANIPVGVQPRNICTSPDDSKLYVANWGSADVSVIDTQTFETITTVEVDYWPQAILALPEDDYVLVANFGFDFTYDHISVIRTSDWQVIARLQTGAGPEDMVAIGPNAEYLYVSNWGMPCCFFNTYDLCCSDEIDAGTITVIAMPDFDAIDSPGVQQGQTPEIPYIQSTLTTIATNQEYSFGMATSPDQTKIYVVNMDSHSMSVIGLDEVVSPTEMPGETCDDPIPLYSPSFCLENCTLGYSDDYNEMCPFDETGAPDLVYQYTPEYTETVNIDLCNSSYDTKIYIYEGTCGSYNSGTAVYCNDDFCGVNGWRSRLEDVTFEAGSTYYIVVDGWGANDSGHFDICFENECPGDLNADGAVTVGDLLLFLIGFSVQFDTPDLLEFLGVIGETCAE